jgi:formiminotetrahydrofolate cyclodeaminase
MLTSRSLSDLLDAFSSPDPTPGGGSAAALIGAVGASLLAMVAAMPKTRTGAADERAALDAARQDLLDAQRTLRELVDRDAAAYDLVVAAFRRPKGTDAEKAARADAIQDAMRVATEVPLETFRTCARALQSGRAVATHGNSAARSDIAVGVQALTTAMDGALFNVEINIGSLKDPAIVGRFTADLRAAQGEATTATRDIYAQASVLELVQQAGARLGGHGRFPED